MENTITTTHSTHAAWIPTAPVMVSPSLAASSLECTPADVRGRTFAGRVASDEQTHAVATGIDATPGPDAWSPPT